MRWTDAEPARNQWNQGNLAYLDGVITRLHDRGFSIVLNINSDRATPGWARATPNRPADCSVHQRLLTDPDGQDRVFAEYARGIASHFADRVAAFELWNEPNISCIVNMTPSTFQQQVLAPGFDAVRAAAPTAMILGAAMGESGPDVWDKWLTTPVNGQQVLVRPVTALDFHKYRTVAATKRAWTRRPRITAVPRARTRLASTATG